MTPAPPKTVSDRIIVRRDLRVVAEHDLAEDRVTIGRAPECFITLEHPSVSREHARLERRGDRWFIVDTGSTNGVLINGLPVREAPLQSSDVIEIRPFTLTYRGPARATADPSLQFSNVSAVTTRAGGAPTATVVRQRLEDLYSLARLVIKRGDDGSFWLTFHAALERSLGTARCVLIGVDAGGAYYRLAPRSALRQGTETLDVSRSVLSEVIQSQRGVLVERVHADERYNQAISLAGGQVGSVICVPVVLRRQTHAIVYADRGSNWQPFSADDLEFVTAAVDLATAAIELDDLQDRARELARVRGRVEAAREIQEMLLPQPLPQPAWGRIAAHNVPADQMSGDIYDVLLDAQGRLTVLVADVSGKGVPAAFLTAVLQSTMRLSLHAVEDLADVVDQVNTALEVHSPADSFVTLALCRWSPDGRTVELANAGHHAPLWLKSDGSVEPFVERVGLPLGIAQPWSGKIVQYNASQVVTMLMFTDGASEARNAAGDEFGQARIARALAEWGHEGAERTISALQDEVRRFCRPNEAGDDVTLLAAERHERPVN